MSPLSERSEKRSNWSPDEEVVARRLEEFARTRDPELKRYVANAYRGLVIYLARGFAQRGEPLEDLIQQGFVGLLKAIDRFDPDRGVKFTTYATPTITGELRRYFRDKGWDVQVPRRLKEMHLKVRHARENLTATAGESPTTTEIAEHLRVDLDQVEDAVKVQHAYNSYSLEERIGNDDGGTPTTLGDLLGDEDSGFDHAVDREDIRRALETLPERERLIVKWRFYGGLTQREVGARLGISQMHVSRLERRALESMRSVVVA
ncbi:MAG: SigB/SigF/SigG family RNA polymerase sigma factor [Bacillota bacterium]